MRKITNKKKKVAECRTVSEPMNLSEKRQRRQTKRRRTQSQRMKRRVNGLVSR